VSEYRYRQAPGTIRGNIALTREMMRALRLCNDNEDQNVYYRQ
jgi:hypothetical protein